MHKLLSANLVAYSLHMVALDWCIAVLRHNASKM